MFKKFLSLVASVVLLTSVAYSGQKSLETVVREWSTIDKYAAPKKGVIESAKEVVRKDLLRYVTDGGGTILDVMLMYYYVYEGFAGKKVGPSDDHYVNAKMKIDEMHKNNGEQKVLDELEVGVVAGPATVSIFKYKGMIFVFPTLNLFNEFFVLDADDAYFGDTPKTLIKMDKRVYDLDTQGNKGE